MILVQGFLPDDLAAAFAFQPQTFGPDLLFALAAALCTRIFAA